MTEEHISLPLLAGLPRREFLMGGIATSTTMVLSASSTSDALAAQSHGKHLSKENLKMNTVTTKDGTKIFYKDWGSGQPIVFHHGWPLSADDWDTQLMFFFQHGYRVIAHDRRGHGRSTQTGTGNDMDTYAADVAVLTNELDLRDAIHIGHSTGGGEALRYTVRHGQGRVAKLVMISAVPPIMVETPDNPIGLPISVLDGVREQTATNRAQFFMDFTLPFYGYNRPGATISEGVRQNWWRQGMMGGALPQYEGIKAFSETDFTSDLKAVTVPTLVMQGDDDQVVPYKDASLLQAKLVKGSVLKIYPGYPHGMPVTHAEPINADILAFIRG
jgi:non-heme chloroperoxidase